jgi:hypothetical protein
MVTPWKIARISNSSFGLVSYQLGGLLNEISAIQCRLLLSRPLSTEKSEITSVYGTLLTRISWSNWVYVIAQTWFNWVYSYFQTWWDRMKLAIPFGDRVLRLHIGCLRSSFVKTQEAVDPTMYHQPRGRHSTISTNKMLLYSFNNRSLAVVMIKHCL